MQRVISRQHLGGMYRLRTPTEIRNESARFAHDEAAGSRVPIVEAAFPETVESTGCEPGEIK